MVVNVKKQAQQADIIMEEDDLEARFNHLDR